MTLKLLLLITIISSSFSIPLFANNKIITIATLEWPPYTSANLPDNGATTAVMRAAFKKAGYDVKLVFRPWNRAIAMAKSGTENVDGYFPGYHCDHHNKSFIASNSMGNSPLGFAKNTDNPFTWTTYKDLKLRRIGTVLGYANTPELDNLIAEKKIMGIVSHDDRTNLVRLASKNIDAAVIDRLVMKHLILTDPVLKPISHKIKFDVHTLDNKELFLCLRKNDEGRKIRDIFNIGLSKIDSSEIIQSYFKFKYTN